MLIEHVLARRRQLAVRGNERHFDPRVHAKTTRPRFVDHLSSAVEDLKRVSDERDRHHHRIERARGGGGHRTAHRIGRFERGARCPERAQRLIRCRETLARVSRNDQDRDTKGEQRTCHTEKAAHPERDATLHVRKRNVPSYLS
jgi:hypothetical protein